MALADFKNSIVTQDKFSSTFTKFDAAVSKSARGVDNAAKAVSGGGLVALAGGAAGVFAVQQIGRTVWQLGELGAQSLTTKASFETLMAAVGQSPALLDRLSAAAGGTISEMTLMQQANSALAGTTGQLSTEMAAALPKLLEAGRAAAKLNPAYGDAAFMFQSLVSGVKRGTPMLIDNTGITIKIGEATEEYAASIGKTVTELTAQERSLAILQATLTGADTLIAQAGGSARSMAEDMAAAAVATQELKTALGELIAPTIADLASGGARSLRMIRALLEDDVNGQMSIELQNQIDLLKLMDQEIANGREVTDAFAASYARAETRVRELQHALLASETAERAAALELIHLTNASEGARWGMSMAEIEAQQMASAFDVAGNQARQLRMGLDELRTANQTITPGLSGEIDKAIAGNTFTGSYGSAVNALAGTPMEWDAVNRASLEFANSIASLNTQLDDEKITLGQYNFEVERLRHGLSETVSGFNNVSSAAGDYADKLKGLIGQQLKPTFDLSGLTGGALGGMSGNTFDEAYKRLAAVALRPQEELAKHAGDWADTFEQAGLTGLTPEEAQARANELVVAYSKGLDFSLIDREAIKDNVRQAIKAEELYNSVVDEIYAEMGKANPKAGQAGYALGKQIGNATAQALKDMAPDAVAAMANAVAPSVAKIISQDAARYKL